MLPVFISYARRTSAAGARALHDALAGLAFLDERHLQPGEAFPAHIADALLGSRVAVVFADDAYFDSWYCRWELDAALQPYARAAAREEEPARQLDPLVVVLPPGHRSAGDLDRFPPEIQATHWNTADDIGAIVDLVRRRLERCSQTLAQRCVSLGQSPDTLRAELLERSAGADLPPAAGPIQRYPRQLPVSKGAGFVGRARDLWRIDHALGGARPAAALEGGGGVGKTQLALEYVHRLGPRRFPHGLYWIDADGDLEEQHHGILRTLAPDVPDLAAYRASRGQPGARTVRDDLSAALAGLAPGSRILFVVDNIPEPAAGERPRPLEWWCPSHDRVAVLTTSRARLGPSDGVHVLPVGVLERPPAIQLLAAGAPAGHRADDAGQVVEWVGRLPLALVLLNAAVRLGSTTVAELAAKAAEPVGQASELDEQMRVLEPLVPPGALRGIAQAFTLSYELLDAEARGAARLLARLAPAPIPVELIRELQLSRSARAVLTARSFVTAHDGAEAPVVPMFGAMHRVLADYLRSRSEEPAAEWTRACKALTAILARALRARDQWALQQAAVAHAQYVAGTQTPGAHVPEELPAALADVLARSFADLGMLEPALEAGDRAVAAYERLARERPIAFEPACALSLIALSTYLEALGRLEAADEAGERAASLLERLAQSSVEAYGGPLAATLATLAALRLRLARWAAAAQSGRSAVDLCRRLGGSFDGELARSLIASASALRMLGQFEEALAAAEAAVDVYRRMARSRPDLVGAGLAGFLGILSDVLAQLGRPEQAVVAAQEAVETYRRLARGRPEVFEPALATSLRALANALGTPALLRLPEALEASGGAVEIFRRLARSRAARFEPELATVLVEHAFQLNRNRRPEEALEAIREAVEVLRRLARRAPEAFDAQLAHALQILGSTSSNLGDKDEALRVSGEVVEIYRRLAEARPAAVLPQLAEALVFLGAGHFARDEHTQERAAREEIVAIFRRLACESPEVYEPALADALILLSGSLSRAERRAEAVAACEEAVALRARLARARPGDHHFPLAVHLRVLSGRLREAGRPGEGLAALRRSVELQRQLASADPARWEVNYAHQLNDLVKHLREAGNDGEAERAGVVAAQILARHPELTRG